MAVFLGAALPLSTSATLAQVPPAAAARAGGGPAVQHDRPVPTWTITPSAAKTPPRRANTTPSVTWPVPGVAEVPVPGLRDTGGPAPARVGGLPVWVGAPSQAGASSQAGVLRRVGEPTAPPPGRAAASPRVPARVQVQVLPAAAARRAGVTGVLLRVGRADGAAEPGPVSLEVDYSGFRHAFGGDWAARLGLVQLPECALTSPARRACAARPVSSRNDVAAGRVSAEVDAAPATAGSVFALTAATAGSTGDYQATPLSPSASWGVSAQSGSFFWSYPLRVPPVPGGLAPRLSISYDSGGVDGATASSNNQPSALGQGWDLSPGYIERKYKACSDDGHPGFGDLCWGGDNLTMALNGRAVELVKDAATGVWHPQSDDGSRVEQVLPATAVNGARLGEYWRVTTTDGTQYTFGLHKLPGWTTGQLPTDSTWTVPVYGDDSGEPCYNATFTSAACDQGWRWNLDYVADPHGNTASYYYTKQPNFYDKGHGSLGVAYVAGGTLAKVVYGTRTASNYLTAPAQVMLGTANRCKNACAPLVSNPGPGTDNADWPDLPSDQYCATTTCTGKYAPTFWTTKRLSSITTQINTGTGYTPVDSWTLAHSFTQPGDGTDGVLELDAITHTGQAPAAGNIVGAPIALPPVSFVYVLQDNRVDGTDTLPAMPKPRIQQIFNGSGGELDIAYSPHECTTAAPPTQESNTKRCFPLTWTPRGQPEVHDWFHKYVVTDVTARDNVGGAAMQQTHYDYLGGAAWHFDDADEITPLAKRSWSQWRGYTHVRSTEGSSPASVTDGYYYRGMDGDRTSPSGGSTSGITVADADGTTHPDLAGLAGFTLQTLSFDGGTEISRQTVAPARVVTATHTVADSGRTVNAFMVNPGTQIGRIRATSLPGGYRTTQVDQFYDGHGNLTRVNDKGDLATTDDDRCVTTTYAANATKWMYSYPSQVTALGVDCDATAANPISLVRTYYDNSTTQGQLTGAGDPTRTDTASGYTGTTPTSFVTASTTYDSVGRPTAVTDPISRVTRTAYTTAPATVVTGGVITQIGLATQATVTNPLNQTASTTLAQAWGVPILSTDVGGRRTELTYDALGRVKEVWLPGRNKPGGYAGNTRYAYTMSNGGALSSLTTTTLGPNGNYTSGYALFDGFLRPRQTQQPAIATSATGTTGRIITDTFYNDRGLAWMTNAPYYDPGAPGTGLVGVLEANIPSETITTYDGAARPTASVLYSYGIEQWGTLTSYDGDRTSVTPPAGGTATTSLTDARGRTSALWQYHGAAPTGLPADADITTYTYARAGGLATITDPAGNVWRYTYDALGRKITDEDPDRGTTTSTYDNAGQLLATIDARGRTLRYTYDALGRRTGEYDAPSGGTQLAAWTYDTAPGGVGLPASATRYAGGNPYTTSVMGYTAGNVGYNPDGFAWGTTISIPTGPLAGSYSFTATPKPDGSLGNIDLPPVGGLPDEGVIYTYDSLGHPKTTEGLFVKYVSATQYTERGLPAKYTLSSGTNAIELTFDHDQATDRLTRSTTVVTGQPTTSDVHYTYDPAGNLTGAADIPQAGLADTQCFAYDHLRRLTEAWTPGSGDCTAAQSVPVLGGAAPYWQSYGYDLNGNRTTQTDHDPAGGGDTTRTYAYPAAGQPHPHALATLTTTAPAGQTTSTYGYDPAGNTTSRALAGQPAQTLDYDTEGHLATLAAGSDTATYVYDANGNRLLAHDTTGDTLYLPYGEELHADTTGAISATRYYTHNGTTVAMRTPNGGNGTITYLATDPHGTAGQAITSTATVTTRRHDPFGNPRGTPPPAWPGNHGYLGALTDPTGLTHLGAREYDPTTARFLTVDPLLSPTEPQSLNAYAYAGNNPTTNSDPSGLLCQNGPDGSCWNPNTGDITPTPGVTDHQGGSPGVCGQTMLCAGPPPTIPGVDNPGSPFHIATDDERVRFRCTTGPCNHTHPLPPRVSDCLRWSQLCPAAPPPQEWTPPPPVPIGDTLLALTLFIPAVSLGRLALTARLELAATETTEAADATAAEDGLSALEQGVAKVPEDWGPGLANKKGVGTRWTDPANPGNGIRIDQGSPRSGWPSQQIDHVVVRSGGQVIGPDGKPIVGSLAENPQAHIPLSDWMTWSSWNHP